MTSCWIITEDLPGTRNQCMALAHAAGLDPVIKTIALRQPWKTVTPWIRHFTPYALASDRTAFSAPWPDIIIASGRKAIAPALWVKKQTRNAARLVIVQSPVIHDKRLDLVIAPQHDRYHGNNALAVTGALSVVTEQTLQRARESWADTLAPLPSPRITVLIGGNSRTHTINEAIAQRMADQLYDLMTRGHGIMITVSRRTPPEIQAILRGRLHDPSVHFWNGQGDNPYHAYLAWADIILVTEDSVSMASEAVSTGKPVYIMKLEGGSERFTRFHSHLMENGYARWFAGKAESWSYTPPNDLGNAAAKLKSLIS